MEDLVLFLDLETTGTRPQEDVILEAAFIMVDLSTLEVRTSNHWIRSAEVYSIPPLWMMDEKVREMHEASGLIADLSRSNPSPGSLDIWLTRRVIRDCPFVTPKKLRLGGYSPHFDLSFLQVHAPVFAKFLSHQLIDVSTIRSLLGAWGLPQTPKLGTQHRAMADCEAALRELALFRAMLTNTTVAP